MTIQDAINTIRSMRDVRADQEERYLTMYTSEMDDMVSDMLWDKYIAYSAMRITLDDVLRVLDEVDRWSIITDILLNVNLLTGLVS